MGACKCTPLVSTHQRPAQGLAHRSSSQAWNLITYKHRKVMGGLGGTSLTDVWRMLWETLDLPKSVFQSKYRKSSTPRPIQTLLLR